jgi:hypothetical protein
MILRCSNDKRASAMLSDYPGSHMVALGFIWLTPPFERISHYTLSA